MLQNKESRFSLMRRARNEYGHAKDAFVMKTTYGKYYFMIRALVPKTYSLKTRLKPKRRVFNNPRSSRIPF
jgi:hypothetical protein